MTYTRFAIYYLPARGHLAEFGAAWLGWDLARGRKSDQPDVPGIEAVTQGPRKYGFHATLKPPFRLREGQSSDELAEAVVALAENMPPARCDGLVLSPMGRFFALTAQGDVRDINHVAATCVKALDAFRAGPTEEELVRRRRAALNVRQEALLARWGYPHVLDEFRFHMTLTGRMPKADLPDWREALAAHLPALPSPFVLDAIALCGERPDGRFELVQRCRLTG